MNGDLVLPTPHAQYSTLPHKNTFKVESSLGAVWDEVIDSVCDKYNMKFNPMFMKNPLHLVFKFISQLTYLLEMVLPYADSLRDHSSLISPEPTSAPSDTYNSLHDVCSFVQWFPKSTRAQNTKKSELSIDKDDLDELVDLSNQVAKTIKSPIFQKYDPFTQDMTTVMNKIRMVFSSCSSLAKSTDNSVGRTVHRAYHVDKRLFNKNRMAAEDTALKVSNNDESHDNRDSIVLCLPCAPSAVAGVVSSRSGKRKWKAWGDEDAFSRPNRHVNNGYCPCCD